ncbi:MAG: hypothetical protein ACRD22_10175 [Terriglobia bacterium]
MFQCAGFDQAHDLMAANGKSSAIAPNIDVCPTGEDLALLREFFELLAEWEEEDSHGS